MKRYNLKSGNILEVIQDDDAQSPDTWGNADMFLVYDHKQFTVKRKGFPPKYIYDYLDEKTGTILDHDLDLSKLDNFHIFNVAAHIHSGIHLQLNNSSFPFQRGWDTSTTGFVIVKKEDIVEGKKPTIITEAEALQYAEGLIKTWNQYLSGDIYGFRIIKKTNEVERLSSLMLDQFKKTRHLDRAGLKFCKIMMIDILSKNLVEQETEEEIGHCWGFYGEDPKENGMLDNINDELLEE